MGDLWAIVRLLRPFWRRVVLALLLGTATVGSGIALMMSAAWLISTAALQLGIVSLGVAPTAVRLFGLTRALFRYLERLVSHDVTLRLVARLRVWFYERIEPLSPLQLQTFRSGDLAARAVADIDELEGVYLRVLAPPVVAIAVTLATAVLFGRLDGQAAPVVFGCMAACGALLPALAIWTGTHAGRRLVAERAQRNAQLVDAVQGMADGVAFGYAPVLRAGLERASHAAAQQERRLGWLDGLQSGLAVLLVNGSAVAVLWTAVGRLDGVWLAAVALGVVAAFEAITPLAAAGRNFGRQREAARRVLALGAQAPAVADPARPSAALSSAPALSAAPALSLERVTFGYGPDEPPVLVDFSLDAPFGSHILLTGPSGAGKSSLINVLLRLVEYQAGRITVGGVDLRAPTHDELRGLFGVMTQQTYLFNTTIRENIRIGRPTAADAEIVAAARAAQIDDFIRGLPDGYDTRVGEAGGLLSGGERQRIALARMLLKDAPIWLLDEITANLDPVTAVNVLQAVLAAGDGRTVIVVTHRPEPVAGHPFDRRMRLSPTRPV